MRGQSATPERFWSLVEKTETCWLWLGHLSRGYGGFASTTAHRFAWQLLRGPIPEGLHIDHLCRVRHCVNPDHLEPVTQGENTLRGESLSAQRARQTHCKAGHPLDRVLTWPVSGKRYRACSECLPKRERTYRQLTADRVQEVRTLRATGLKYYQIARVVGISRSEVHRIVTGQRWASVQQEVAS